MYVIKMKNQVILLLNMREY